MARTWKKKIVMATTGFLLAFPLLGAARSGNAATTRSAKLTATVHYEEIYHMALGVTPTESMHGTADSKLIVDFSFERPIQILQDGPQLDF